jgi:hypothetical protein
MFDKIVWITGMPRSGTSWLAQIFASSPDVRLKLCPLFSYEFKNEMSQSSTPTEWKSFFKNVYTTPSDYMDQNYLRKDGIVPHFEQKSQTPSFLTIKSTRQHQLTETILEKCPEVTFVAIVRHPCACIHSWLTNPHEFPKSASKSTEWRTGACRKDGLGEYWGFDDWKEVTRHHLALAQRFPDRFFLIRYESLVKQAFKITSDLFSSLGINFTPQTEEFLTESQSTHCQHARSVYKSPFVSERWKNELTPEIANTILSEIKGTDLEQFAENV